MGVQIEGGEEEAPQEPIRAPLLEAPLGVVSGPSLQAGPAKGSSKDDPSLEV